MNRILVVEDDIGLNQGIVFALKGDFCLFFSAYTIQEAKQILHEEKIDLIILDINLPDGNGYEFLAELRRTSQVAVIMLTANDLEIDEVKGLALGADDYITKPFSLMVLRARTERLLARTRPAARVFRDEEFIFDFGNLYFEKKGQEILLSRTEQKVLKLLTDHPGRTMTRDTLMDRVWSDEAEFVDENALSVTINRLRRKLDEKGRKQSHIRTVYGIGYMWETQK